MFLHESVPAGRLPMRFLTAAVLFAGIVLVWLGWSILESYNDAQESHERYDRIVNLRSTILRLDEMLTMSARMAAETGDPQWETRYRDCMPQFQSAIAGAVALITDMADNDTANQSTPRKRKLDILESQVFDWVHDQNLVEAQKVFQSAEYEGIRRANAADLAELASILNRAGQDIQGAEERKVYWSIAFVVVVIFALFAGWHVIWRTMVNMRGTLVASNEQLSQQAVELGHLNASLDQKLAELRVEIAERKLAEERAERLNNMLRAIRDINQRIARESSREGLLKGVCSSLIEAAVFRHVWVAAFDESRQLVTAAESGLGELFQPLVDQMRSGEFVPLVQEALQQPSAVVTAEQVTGFEATPLADQYCGCQAVAMRLEYSDTILGVLVAATDASAVFDQADQQLFEEAASDIAFALHGLKVEYERKQAEEALHLEQTRLEALLQLNQMQDESVEKIIEFALEQGVQLTGSTIGYVAFMNEDETVLTMNSWSKNAMAECAVLDTPIVYPVEETGLWGEAVRQRRAIVTNDYDAPNPLKKGVPEGHVLIQRHMNVPVFDAGRIVAVAGVGNKPTDYDESDVRQLTLLMQGMWRLIQRRETLDKLEQRVSERTAALASANEQLKQEMEVRERAEAVLRDSEALYSSLVDNLPVHVMRKDLEGRFTFANQSFCDLLGKSFDEIQGKTDFDFYPKSLAEKYRADDEHVAQTGEVLEVVEENETDGEMTYVDVMKSPVRDAAGTIVGVQVIFWDVTKRKQAEAALEQERYLLHTLMDNLPQNIYFKDRESRFIRINRALGICFGLRGTADAIGKNDFDFFTTEHAQQAMEDEQEIIRTGRPILDKEEKETWGDGHTTWASSTKMPLYDESGEIVGTFGISQDITEQKLAAEALREAKEAAEAANQAKSDFLANMSHEIRTPMNAVIGMTELILDTELTASQRDYLWMVRDSADALLSVINDVLDFSKIEAGKLELHCAPFNLREAVGDTMKSLAVRAHGKGLELACHIAKDVPDRLAGDMGRLRQVLVNLVGNAIKFTEEGEVLLDVTCQSVTGEDARIHFAVRDTGIGIPADKLDSVFGAFEQADRSTTRRYGGTGLGLAIASKLVSFMGGKIEVESEESVGSTFHFAADFGIPPGGEVADLLANEPAVVRDTRVLIVDDNATNRLILAEMLTNWGMIPTCAAGAHEAIGLMRHAIQMREPFRLVLTDANMPELDGFGLAEEVKHDSKLGSTIIMMLTSGDRPGDISRCDDLGVAAYLLKPVKQSELFDAIVLALGITSPEDAASGGTVKVSELALPSLTILLAEDSLVNQKLAVALLEKFGHNVVVANDGREAVAAVAREKFDLVLMDVQMPEMDGFEATGLIRSEEKHSQDHLPIIAMTAHAMKGDRERCLEAGMDDYVAKPIRVQLLFDTIAATLTRLGRITTTDAASTGEPVKPKASQTETVVAEAADAEASGETTTAVANDGNTAEIMFPEGLDWAHALSVVRNDHELLQIVVEAAVTEVPRKLTDIREAIANDDASTLQLAAHTVKGSLRYFGTEPAIDLAFQLEKKGAAGDFDETECLVDQLDEACNQLMPALTAFLEQFPPQ